MNQRMLRTMMFVGGAAICLGAAVATSIATRPVTLDDASLVGQEFYPEFQDPTKATSLRVAAYDKDAAKVKLFDVEFKDGLWRIPSHHNYPADGEEQLAKTAASVVGIERGLYSGKTQDDQKRMGVLDPLDDSVTGTEGRGARITLSQGGKALVDLIVGNKVDEAGNIYYVRRADEQRVYRAELAGLKVSTKFADWIEPDLLKLDPSKLVQMVIDRYQIDEQRGSLVQGEISVLNKDTDKTPAAWELEGLNAETEKVKTVTVNQMTSSLDNLKIAGVREKPAGLVAALKGEEGARLNQIEEIQMQRAGFFLTPDRQLVSNEGEILAGTNEGVRYTLRFGVVISGSDVDIEIGSEPDEAEAEDAAKAEGDSAAADDATDKADAGDNADDATDDSSVKKNRYVFITATFDEKLLGERPKAPVKPVPPSETPSGDAEAAEPAAESANEEPATPDASGDAADGEENASDAPAEEAKSETEVETAADQPAADEEETGEAKPADEPDPRKVFEEAEKKYEADLKDYETRNAAFDKKIEDGEKAAKELNDRFAPWYYVISADLFEKLKVDRSALVEPATPATTTPAGGAAGTTPVPPSITLPPSIESDDAVSPAADSTEEKPADAGDEKPAAEEAKPADASDAPASDDSPADGDSPSTDAKDSGESESGSEQ